MEFRLIYEGKLPSGNRPHPKEKRVIRKIFHKQLLELWEQTPELKKQLEDPLIVYRTPSHLISVPGPNVTQIVRTTKRDPGGKPKPSGLGTRGSGYGGKKKTLTSKAAFAAPKGSILRISTPGAGGWGGEAGD